MQKCPYVTTDHGLDVEAFEPPVHLCGEEWERIDAIYPWHAQKSREPK